MHAYRNSAGAPENWVGMSPGAGPVRSFHGQADKFVLNASKASKLQRPLLEFLEVTKVCFKPLEEPPDPG